MRILAVPAFSNRSTNPFNTLLYQAVERAGVAVTEVSPAALFRGDRDVVHLHWPEYLFSAPSIGRAVAQAVVFALALTRYRRHGARILWTIHNLGAHEPWHPRFEAWMWRWCIARLDAVITLSAGGYAAAAAWQPDIALLPVFTILHGHYRDAYPREMTRSAARSALSLPQDAPVMVFFGAIRSYKNIPALIDAFLQLPEPDWRLVIAGQATNARLAETIRRRAAGDSRIHLHLQFVENERVQVYVRTADLVVLPYTEILNSGSALLALSFGRPTLVPNQGAMAELRREVGDAWVCTYDGELTTATLRDAMRWATSPGRDAAPPLENRDWDAIASRTVDAYRQVVAMPAATHPPTAWPRIGPRIRRRPRSARAAQED